MNNKPTDIATVRHLLDQYYLGLTTPDQERQLAHWAHSTPDSAIPADLRADAAMLRELYGHSTPHTRAEAERVANATISRLSRRHRIRPAVWSIAAAVAAACLIIAIGMRPEPVRQPAAAGPEPTPVVAQITPTPEPTPSHAPIEAPATAARRTPRHTAARPTPAPREVTDTAEATAIITDALRLLASNIGAGRRTVIHSTDAIDRTLATSAEALRQSEI